MGLYRRRDNSAKGRVWWISYMIAGQQHRESSGSTNKRIAEKLLALRKTQVFEDRWSLPKSNAPLLEEFAERYLKTIQHENTRDRYQASLSNVKNHLGAKVRLSDITPERIYAFQQSRLAEGTRKATVNRDVAALSSMLSRAKKLRFISRNPCTDVEKLNERQERRQAKPLDYEQEARIKRFSPPWLQMLITLLADTGLRVKKEALPLKWSDVLIDSDPACIHVRESKSVAGVRPVWLTKHCRDALLSWRELLGPEFSPYVFPSPRNSAKHIVDYKKAWIQAAEKANLAEYRIYDLRATLASRANACRASALTVAHLLGHASTQILPTYVKPIDENTRAVVDALDVARTSQTNRTTSLQ